MEDYAEDQKKEPRRSGTGQAGGQSESPEGILDDGPKAKVRNSKGRNKQALGKTRLRQRGTLFIYHAKRGDEWRGRFRSPKHHRNGRRKEVTVLIGDAQEMSEVEARQKLTEFVGTVNRDVNRVLSIKSETPADTLCRPLPSGSRNRRNVGILSEMTVCMDLTARGYDVYRAINPQASCDLIAIIDGEFARVEVKTAKETNGLHLINLKTKEGRFDVLAVVERNGEVTYRPYSDMVRDTQGSLACVCGKSNQNCAG